MTLRSRWPWNSTETPSGVPTTTTRSSTRDRKLISTDEHLTGDALDDLWTWFCNASRDGDDPQQIFAKIVNSARKPYVDRVKQLQHTLGTFPATPSTSSHSTSSSHEFFKFWRPRSSCSTTSSATSSATSTVTDHDSQSFNDESVHEQCQQLTAAQATTSELRIEKRHLDAKDKSLKAKMNSLPPTPSWPLRVVIKSVSFRDRYIQMDGSGITSYMDCGGGRVKVQTSIGDQNIFELVRHPESNIVSFKSTCFKNIYLRAYAQDMGKGHTRTAGGGLINCQYGCGDMEKFRLLSVGSKQGEVAIESLKFPERFVRVDGNWFDNVNLQGQVSAWEMFYLVIVP